MTRAAIEAAKNADYRRYEAYTALWSNEDLEALEAEIGDIQRVMRPEVEEPVELLQLAKSNIVALLVVGDPLQATTHVDLQLQAQEAGVECSVVHGVSITGLVTGAVGLSNYRFGRQTTLTYPYGGVGGTFAAGSYRIKQKTRIAYFSAIRFGPNRGRGWWTEANAAC